MVTLASESGNSFRRFLELITEGADLREAQEGWDAIWQALDEVEASVGPVPLAGNDKASQAFSEKMKVRQLFQLVQGEAIVQRQLLS